MLLARGNSYVLASYKVMVALRQAHRSDEQGKSTMVAPISHRCEGVTRKISLRLSRSLEKLGAAGYIVTIIKVGFDIEQMSNQVFSTTPLNGNKVDAKRPYCTKKES